MSNLILLFLCLSLGVAFRKAKLLPKDSPKVLNAFVINISLTALSLYYIPKIELTSRVIYPVLVAWIGLFAAVIFFNLLGKAFSWERQLIGALILCAGFANTSFVGIPVIQALYGEYGIKTVMLVDQPGSFVALSTVGIVLANLYSGEGTSFKSLLAKVLKFPPFIAFIIALTMNIVHYDFVDDWAEVFNKLGTTTVPLALISVGMQLKVPKFDHHVKPLIWGLVFKLIIFPMIIFVIYILVLRQRGSMIEISVMEAAMAPMITSAIIAASHGVEPKLCNMLVGIGIPLSFLTLGLWYLLLQII